jgi:hypothetical protein
MGVSGAQRRTGLSAPNPQLCLWQSLRDFHFNPSRRLNEQEYTENGRLK